MLTVQPNAGARIFYFERRAQAMFGKREGEGAEEVGAGPSASDGDGDGNGDGDGDGNAKGAHAVQQTPCAPRTWGVEPAERTSCDPQ